MKKATLVLSDLHFGDAGQFYKSLMECMDRAIIEINNFKPDVTQVALNGDAAAGRGIFRLQEAQNIVQLGPEQIYWAGWEIRQWDRRLDNKAEWYIILGNHDHSNRENLARQLVLFLRLLGINARYADREFIGYFGDKEAAFHMSHGFGYSSYYANSYSEIRAAWKKFIEIAQIDGIHIDRFIRAHVHKLNLGQEIGLNCQIDTSGGWHKQERISLEFSVQTTGVLLYLHNAGAQPPLTIKAIEANRDLLLSENKNIALHYRNMEAAGRVLSDVAAWGRVEGIW